MKRNTISDAIRQKIVNGHWPPGRRLPTRQALADQYKAGPNTIQAAIDHLARDGFIHARGRLGTFVALNPPHLADLAIIAPTQGSIPSPFVQAIMKAAVQVAEQSGLTVRPYYIDPQSIKSDEWEQLHDDVIHHRFGGIIFLWLTSLLAKVPALSDPGIPSVQVSSEATFGIPAIYPDEREFDRRAVEHLRALGRKRIAHLLNDAVHMPSLDAFYTRVRASDPTVQQHHILVAPPHSQQRSVATSVYMMMHLQGESRPDSIIVYDDNLTQPVLAGLMQAGVRIKEDIEVVMYTNFPTPTHDSMPITRLGFDCVKLVEQCVGQIESQRRQGQKTTTMLHIPAEFEHEVLPSHI